LTGCAAWVEGVEGDEGDAALDGPAEVASAGIREAELDGAAS